jgi:hypothetical protein
MIILMIKSLWFILMKDIYLLSDMNLVTHAVFGLAIGFIFFGRVDIAI